MLYVVSVLFGLILGSFANVCIVRLPLDRSLWRPRSHCPHCKNTLKAIHNIPVISWLVLKGRCAFCQASISPRYPIVEALMASLFLANALYFGDGIPFIAVADVLVFFLLTISIIDYQHRIIPDELSLSLLAIGLLFSFMNPYFTGAPWKRFLVSFASALGGGLLMLFLAWAGEKAFKKEAMGGGDVKLIAATASILGWAGIMGPLLIGSLSGGALALALLAMNKKKLGETLPFGPFLSLGAYWVCLFPNTCAILFGLK